MKLSVALAGALALVCGIAHAQTYPFPNAPYAGERGASQPSTNDQILVQQGVNTHDPVGSPARMTLGTLQGLIGGLPLSGGTLTGPLTAPSITSTGAIAGNVTAPGGTAARALAASLADLPNARNYGVKCDGSTDDAVSLQAFVNSIASGGSLGTNAGVISGSATPCMVSTAIVIPAGVALYAQPGTVTLKATAGNTSSPLVVSVTGSNVFLYGLTFDGNYSANTSYSSPLTQVYQASGVVFDHDVFQNSNNIGLNVSGGTTQAAQDGVRDSIFQHIGIRYKATGSSADQHQGVAFSNGTLASNTGDFVQDNYFTDTGLDAISLGNLEDFTIRGNRCETVGGNYATSGLAVAACIYLSTGALNNNGVISHNVSHGAQGNGIEVNGNNISATGNAVVGSGASGMQFDGTNLVGTGNLLLNNNQATGSPGATTEQAGIVLTGTTGPVTLSTNLSTDNQGTKTQQYGLQVLFGSTLTGIVISPDNVFTGNASAEMNGTGVGGYTLMPGNTSTGSHSLAGGVNASAGNTGSFAFGTSAFSTGAYSEAFGWDVSDRARYATRCSGAGFFHANADEQYCTGKLQGTGSGAIRLTADGATANAVNCINIPTAAAYQLRLQVVAIDHAAPANSAAWSTTEGVLSRSGVASTTAWAQQIAGSLASTGTGSAATMAIAADTTNSCLNVTVTPPGTDSWDIVASWETVEVQ